MQEVVVDKTGNINEEPIDDDHYNEIVRLVAQEEENQAILSVTGAKKGASCVQKAN